jgi:hypothetical protein
VTVGLCVLDGCLVAWISFICFLVLRYVAVCCFVLTPFFGWCPSACCHEGRLCLVDVIDLNQVGHFLPCMSVLGCFCNWYVCLYFCYANNRNGGSTVKKIENSGRALH